MSECHATDLTIVGAGPAGLYAACDAGFRGLSVTLVDSLPEPGGQVAALSPVQRVMDSSVRVLTHTEVAAIHGVDTIESIDMFDNQTDERETLRVQAVVAALGFTSDLGPLKSWDVQIDGRNVLVDTCTETTLPGVFAAGDITEYEGKVRLISVGFGESAIAVNNAAVHIDPDARVFPGHSSG